MALRVGSAPVAAAYLGSTPVTAVYLGTVLVWTRGLAAVTATVTVAAGTPSTSGAASSVTISAVRATVTVAAGVPGVRSGGLVAAVAVVSATALAPVVTATTTVSGAGPASVTVAAVAPTLPLPRSSVTVAAIAPSVRIGGISAVAAQASAVATAPQVTSVSVISGGGPASVPSVAAVAPTLARTIKPLVATVSAAALAPTASGSAPPAFPVPVSAFGFPEGSGSTTASQLGGRTLTATTPASAWAAGKSGNGNAAGGRFTGALAASMSTWSIAFDLYIAASPDWASPIEITSDDTYFEYDSARVFDAFLGGADGLVQGTALPSATWVNVALTHDDATNTSKLYVDGSLVVTKTHSTSIGATNFADTAAQVCGSTAQPLTGRLDNLRIWNVVLTAAQITTAASTPV